MSECGCWATGPEDAVLVDDDCQYEQLLCEYDTRLKEFEALHRAWMERGEEYKRLRVQIEEKQREATYRDSVEILYEQERNANNVRAYSDRIEAALALHFESLEPPEKTHRTECVPCERPWPCRTVKALRGEKP